MKKIVLVMFVASMGFANSVWSAQGAGEERLLGLPELESLKIVPRPGKPIRPR